MPQSKKQAAVQKASLKKRIEELETELRFPVINSVKKANLQYELDRLKKNL